METILFTVARLGCHYIYLLKVNQLKDFNTQSLHPNKLLVYAETPARVTQSGKLLLK
jgi:hypothetical protein